MNENIKQLFLSDNGLCPEGRALLSDRNLSIPSALRAGVASFNDNFYFAYKQNGEIVRWKYRSMKDKKKMGFNSLEEKDKADFKMPFYNQQNWPKNDYLIITEGEFDCIALLEILGSNVVSLPNGAGSLESTFRNQYEYLQNFKTIYLCMDMDEAGDLAAKKAMSLLSPLKYRRIMLPCKDANDWVLKNDVGLEDLEMLMLNAKRIEDKAFTNMLFLDDSFYEQVPLGTSSGWDALDEILGGIRLGELTVVTADTGAGKSTFCLNLMYNIAEKGHPVWINSYELKPITVHRKFASIVLKKKMKYDKFSESDKSAYKDWLKKNHCFLNISNTKISLEELRKQFEAASYAYETKYILIDHFDYIHGSGKKLTSLENIDASMREIHALAMEFDVAVILVAHPTKTTNSQELTMSDLKGSSAIKQYADNILVITRRDRNDKVELNKVKVRIWKNRLCGTEQAFYLKYCPEFDGYEEWF